MKNVTKLDDIYDSDNDSDNHSDNHSDSDNNSDSKSLFSLRNIKFIISILQLILISILLYFIIKIYNRKMY